MYSNQGQEIDPEDLLTIQDSIGDQLCIDLEQIGEDNTSSNSITCSVSTESESVVDVEPTENKKKKDKNKSKKVKESVDEAEDVSKAEEEEEEEVSDTMLMIYVFCGFAVVIGLGFLFCIQPWKTDMAKLISEEIKKTDATTLELSFGNIKESFFNSLVEKNKDDFKKSDDNVYSVCKEKVEEKVNKIITDEFLKNETIKADAEGTQKFKEAVKKTTKFDLMKFSLTESCRDFIMPKITEEKKKEELKKAEGERVNRKFLSNTAYQKKKQEENAALKIAIEKNAVKEYKSKEFEADGSRKKETITVIIENKNFTLDTTEIPFLVQEVKNERRIWEIIKCAGKDPTPEKCTENGAKLEVEETEKLADAYQRLEDVFYSSDILSKDQYYLEQCVPFKEIFKTSLLSNKSVRKKYDAVVKAHKLRETAVELIEIKKTTFTAEEKKIFINEYNNGLNKKFIDLVIEDIKSESDFETWATSYDSYKTKNPEAYATFTETTCEENWLPRVVNKYYATHTGKKYDIAIKFNIAVDPKEIIKINTDLIKAIKENKLFKNDILPKCEAEFEKYYTAYVNKKKEIKRIKDSFVKYAGRGRRIYK